MPTNFLKTLHSVILSRIDPVNDNIRLLRLAVPPSQTLIKFQPGQWLDVYVPNVPKAGGFTITSPPSCLIHPPGHAPTSVPNGYLELAIQRSPTNPPAAWIWRPSSEILGSELQIRVGGSFVWPPCYYGSEGIRRVVFIAGGVGINPLMSMLSHIAETGDTNSFDIKFLYSVRDPGSPRKTDEILFLNRLHESIKKLGTKGQLSLYLTSSRDDETKAGEVILSSRDQPDGRLKFERRRITEEDLLGAIGPIEERKDTVCYICGVPTMTDVLVKKVQNAEGTDPRHVLYERWW